MRTKRILAMLLGVSMMISIFAGCGGTGKSGQEPVDKTKEGVTTIKFGIHVADPEKQETVTWKIVNAFNKKYEGKYRVEFESAEKSAHDQSMKLEATDGTLPELFWCDSAQAPEFASAGHLMDLTDFLKDSSDTGKALGKSMQEAFQNDKGMQYGLPYQANVEGFFYNKKVLAQAGVKEPIQGTGFDEFLDMCQKLNGAGITPIAQGSTDNYAIWAYLMFLDRYGYSENISKILEAKKGLNNPDMVSCFKKLAKLKEVKAFPENMSTLSYFDAKASFEAGKCAFMNTGAWDAAEFDQKIGDQIGFWWGPTFADSSHNQKCAMKVPSAPICVSAEVAKDAAKKEAVYAFLNFYYSKDAANISYEGSVFPATNYTDVKISDTQYALKAVKQALSADGWTSPKAQPDQILNAATQNQLYDSMLGVMMGNYKPEDALQKIDEALGNS